ncbi:MAG: Ig-like domain-containing protein, partial [Nitrososphaerales archaeon]
GLGDGQFNSPSGVIVDSSGNVYVSDTLNHRIQKFDSSGNFITKWGSFGSGDGQFNQPEGTTVDSSDNVYVADQNNNRIQKFDSNGGFLAKWGSHCSVSTGFECVDPDGSGPLALGDGQFNAPRGISIDSSGNIFILDSLNHRIQKFDSSGNFITKLGSLGLDNGQFSSPRGIAVDSSGNVYVADTQNHRIQKFAPAVTYIPDKGFTGTDSFTYTISDGHAGTDTATVTINVIQRCNTPDHFGYSCTDSNFQDGPDFSWIDITSSGTQILADDNESVINNIPIGFSFNFYDGRYNDLAITDNGLALVNDSSTQSINRPIGSSNFTNNFIAPFWDNLTTRDDRGAGAIYNQTMGVAPNRIFVVEWFNVQGSPNTPSGATFEIIFYEGTNNIKFQYMDVNFTVPGYDNGVSATVGIESGDGRGLQYSFNEDATYDNLVILFTGPSVSPPNAVEDSAITDLNNPVTVDVLANDSDFNNDTITITSFTNGASGTVAQGLVGLMYTPNISFIGTDSFTYTISDGDNGTDTATVTVLVTPPNNPPIALNDSVLTKVNNIATIDVLANDTDPNSDPLTISSVTQASSGTVAINTGFVTKWGLGSGDGEFASPRDLAVDAFGNLYVVDTGNNRIQKFASNGNFDTKWGSYGSGKEQFSFPRGIAVDSSGFVYVADTLNSRIQKFDSEGGFEKNWGSFGTNNGQFKSTGDVAVDSSGFVYVVDSVNNRIQKFDSSGNFVTKWGSLG